MRDDANNIINVRAYFHYKGIEKAIIPTDY